jgi:hypothetical protein
LHDFLPTYRCLPACCLIGLLRFSAKFSNKSSRPPRLAV